MRETTGSGACSIIPPYLLEAIARSGDPVAAERAAHSLEHDALMRERREGRPGLRGQAAPGPELPAPGTPAGPSRLVSDAQGREELPGTAVRREGEPATGDLAVDEAYDGLGLTWELFRTSYGRNSLDGRGMPLLATVHFGQRYENAFWDGTQMVFGDGDGRYFRRFTASLDVIGHELAHAVTEHTAGLTYRGQSGALNESISDVFGSLVRQWSLGQDAHTADWLIGADLFTDAVQGVALRSLRAPGTAYDDPVLGKDPQPAHLKDYVETTADNGGVHINSGIPNHAFYLAATAIEGQAWQGAGRVWYAALTGDGIAADCDFATFAELTVAAARVEFGFASREAQAVETAWRQVGVLGMADDPEPEDLEPVEADPVGPDPVERHPLEPATEVVVRRSGGFAGLTRERSLRLSDLPMEDTARWQRLLGGPALRAWEAGPSRPDAYCYDVVCPAAQVDVSLPEPALPREVRDLLERTLDQG